MKNKILLSTDTMGNYGLDVIFDTAKKAGFDGIDLAIWKWFDAWNEKYVQSLVKKYELPVYSIQTSPSLNAKELHKVLDLCLTTGSDMISINSPKFFDFKSYHFIINNIIEFQNQNPSLNFSIINPRDVNVFAGIVPGFRFNNVVDIIKKYNCYLALDIAHMDTEDLETRFSNKIEDFIPYLSVIYISDRSKTGVPHLLPWDGVIKIPSFVQKLLKSGYNRHFSLKVDFTKSELVDLEKIEYLLSKSREFLVNAAKK